MKIAIAGYGVEGKASFDYWNQPGNDLTIVDEREHVDVPQDVKTVLGPHAFSHLGDYELIIRSPSVSPKKLPYGDKVWTATNEFFAQCPAVIIGVTGTKGKGTTCSLIASILRAAGKTVHLVGNIGMPALEVLEQIQPGDVVVYELSSFQLWDSKKSPHVAVVLGIEPDHLNVHEDMDDYVKAKAHIALHQTPDDILIFDKNNAFSRQIAAESPASKIEYPFAIDEFVSSLQIPGKHNQENAAAAIAATRQFAVSDEAIQRGLADFTGLPHRLKFIREVNGVKYYDDSFSSATPSAVVAARAFDDPKIVIVGGYDRGLDYAEFGKELAASSNIKRIIVIGQTKQKIADALQKVGLTAVTVSDANAMTEIVAQASSYAAPGDYVILSPGCASFDMFRDFTDRGNQFITAVEVL